MRKITFFCAAILAVMSCNKVAEDSNAGKGQSVDVNICINGDATRATDNPYSNESKVNDLQVFIFGDGGVLEDYKAAGATLSTTLTSSSGVRDIWTVVNAPSLKDITSMSELAAKTSSLVSDNALDNFVMVGSTQAELQDGASVGVTVKRVVSKVTIKKVSTKFSSAVYKAETFTVKGIYLINVAGDCNYGVSAAPTVWLNKLGHSDASADKFLYENVNAVVTESSAYEKTIDFYPYPNPIAEETFETPFSPRHSMLVVDCTIGDQQTYYPIELPVIERNKTYTIDELVITRRGSDVPYKPVDTGESTATITVHDWELGLNLGTITI